MDITEQEGAAKAIDFTTQMFNQVGINSESPNRPSYVDFAVSCKRNGAQWGVGGPSDQKLAWNNGKLHNSLMIEVADSRLRVRFVSIPENREEVQGYTVDKLSSYIVRSVTSADDEITFSGLDATNKPFSFTVNSSGVART